MEPSKCRGRKCSPQTRGCQRQKRVEATRRRGVEASKAGEAESRRQAKRQSVSQSASQPVGQSNSSRSLSGQAQPDSTEATNDLCRREFHSHAADNSIPPSSVPANLNCFRSSFDCGTVSAETPGRHRQSQRSHRSYQSRSRIIRLACLADDSSDPRRNAQIASSSNSSHSPSNSETS